MIVRPCDACGETYEAKTRRSRYCSDRCKRRFHRGARAPENVTPLEPRKRPKKKDRPATVEPVDDGAGPVEKATRMSLAEVDRLDSPLGAAAVVLARRLDEGRDTGQGFASLAKQLQATLEAATAGVQQEADPIDELRARRARKAAGAR
jgi:hypothetical protein